MPMPVTQVFPRGQVPPTGPLRAARPDYWHANPDVRPPSVYPDIEIWQGRIIMAQQFVDLVNSYGGRAHLTHLPDIGIFGNTHFAMSDLNNRRIANLLTKWLHDHGLDGQ